ncbi:MAG TPA: lectin-like protein [Kofleriaceae bacterium]|nr:lectin-like protein [Kofleriaceae bacterium]
MRWSVLMLVGVAACRFGFDDAVHPDAGGSGTSDGSTSQRVCTGYQPVGTLTNTYRMLSARTWLSAEQACEAEGTHLAIVENFVEEAAIRALGNTVWIGTSDRVTEGAFRHVNGATATYTNWASGTSNAAEDCASILSAGMWEDQDCNVSFQGICECDDVGVVAGSY